MAAALLLAGPLPSMSAAIVTPTVYFTQSGLVLSWPTGRISSLVPTAPSFDLQNNSLGVGIDSNGVPYTGTFGIQAGGVLFNAGLIFVGGSAGSQGTLDIGGAGSALIFPGGLAGGRLWIGMGGAGAVRVHDGGSINALPTAATCANSAYSCGTRLAGTSGAIGMMSVTGISSAAKLGDFWVGAANPGWPGGTPGATTTAIVDVLAGATLRTNKAMLGWTPGDASAVSEHAMVSTTIDGVGSQWLVTHNPLSTDNVYVKVGEGINVQSTMTIRNGGEFQLDASGTPAGKTSRLTIGSSGATGLVTVNSGGMITLLGGRSSIAVGDFGGQGKLNVGAGGIVTPGDRLGSLSIGNDIGGNGTVDVFAGGQLRSGLLLVGEGPGATGLLRVRGAGSVAKVDGGDWWGRLAIGLQGNGSVQVLDGGLLDATARLDRCSVASAACNSFVGVLAGSTGSLQVDGSSSRAQLTTLDLGGTYVINDAPGYGGQSGGTGRGSLGITGGGQLQSMSASLGRVRDGSGSIGTERAEGAAMISGNGSVWRIGADTVGPATASLTIGEGARGHGTLNINAGGRLLIDNSGAVGTAALRIGVDGGRGEVSLAGMAGSQVSGPAGGEVSVGHSGIGVLTLSSGSSLSAGFVGVGSRAPRMDGGTGTLTLDNSTLTATLLDIGAHGLVNGDGGLIVGKIVNRGTFNPDPPGTPGTLVIDGRFENQAGGRLVLDIAADGHGGFTTSKLVFTAGSSFDFSGLQVSFEFLGNADPNDFLRSGGFILNSFLKRRGADGVDSGLSSSFAAGVRYADVLNTAVFGAVSAAYLISGFNFTPDGTATFNAVPVPEPLSAALWLLGLTVLGWRMRSHSRCGAG